MTYAGIETSPATHSLGLRFFIAEIDITNSRRVTPGTGSIMIPAAIRGNPASMGLARSIDSRRELEGARRRPLVTYVTSTRPIAEGAVGELLQRWVDVATV